jgi:hypothetical protein
VNNFSQELKKFFKDVKIADNGAAIYIEHDPQRRPTGMAMIKFECETDYITALGMDLRQLAGKIVHIKPATEIELNDFIQRQRIFEVVLVLRVLAFLLHYPLQEQKSLLLYHTPPAYKTLLQYYCLPFYYQFFLELQNMLVNYKS